MNFKTLWKYKGLFEKCYLEPAVTGWSLFDKENNFVGMIQDDGFWLNWKYEHSDKIEAELTKRGIDVMNYEIATEIKNEYFISSL